MVFDYICSLQALILRPIYNCLFSNIFLSVLNLTDAFPYTPVWLFLFPFPESFGSISTDGGKKGDNLNQLWLITRTKLKGAGGIECSNLEIFTYQHNRCEESQVTHLMKMSRKKDTFAIKMLCSIIFDLPWVYITPVSGLHSSVG